LPVFTLLYFGAYFGMLRWFRLEEVGTIVAALRQRLRRRKP